MSEWELNAHRVLMSQQDSFTRVTVSSDDQTARTCTHTLRSLARMVGTDRFYDPCPEGWFEGCGWDGLKDDWPRDGRWSYVNPPFGHAGKFVEKIKQERSQGAKVVLLMPFKPETETTKLAMNGPCACDHVAIAGYVRFVGYQAALPVMIGLFIWGDGPELPNNAFGPLAVSIMDKTRGEKIHRCDVVALSRSIGIVNPPTTPVHTWEPTSRSTHAIVDADASIPVEFGVKRRRDLGDGSAAVVFKNRIDANKVPGLRYMYRPETPRNLSDLGRESRLADVTVHCTRLDQDSGFCNQPLDGSRAYLLPNRLYNQHVQNYIFRPNAKIMFTPRLMGMNNGSEGLELFGSVMIHHHDLPIKKSPRVIQHASFWKVTTMISDKFVNESVDIDGRSDTLVSLIPPRVSQTTR